MNDKFKCSRCKVFKNTSDFYTNPSQPRGYDYMCKECVKEDKRKTHNSERQKKATIKYRYEQYGLTEQSYQRMRVAQDFKCKICGLPELDSPKKKLHIDHCHTTGKVRGLLCSQCNVSLGLVKESKETLLKMIKYLEV